MKIAEMLIGMIPTVLKDVLEWINGRDSVYDYTEFAKRVGGKFKSEILLEREKNRIKNKPHS
jgi:hypothetical protein